MAEQVEDEVIVMEGDESDEMPDLNTWLEVNKLDELKSYFEKGSATSVISVNILIRRKLESVARESRHERPSQTQCSGHSVEICTLWLYLSDAECNVLFLIQIHAQSNIFGTPFH